MKKNNALILSRMGNFLKTPSLLFPLFILFFIFYFIWMCILYVLCYGACLLSEKTFHMLLKKKKRSKSKNKTLKVAMIGSENVHRWALIGTSSSSSSSDFYSQPH